MVCGTDEYLFAWIIGTCVFCIIFFLLSSNKRKNYPPGPRGLPLVGYTPFLGTHIAKAFHKLSKKYGPIISVPVGLQSWIILNDYDMIYEALVKQGAAFSGRQKLYVLEEITEGLGILTTDGNEWKIQRKFGLNTLRG